MIGLGSDIGGSLRSPVAFCGAWSLKPTVGRHLSQAGVVSAAGAPVCIPVTGGFMTRSARALEQAWRSTWALTTGHNIGHDPLILPPVWSQSLYDKKPTVGYFTGPGIIPPATGCVRAVEETKTLLEEAGYTVVPVPAPDIRKVLHYFNGIVLADGIENMHKTMKWDVYDSSLNGLVAAITAYNVPRIIRDTLLYPLIGLFTRAPPIRTLFSRTADLWDGHQEVLTMISDYLTMMDSAGVDLILCPGQMLPAPPTGELGTMVAGVLTYIPWNLFNFPAGIAPVTEWSAEDDERMEAEYPRDDMITRMISGYCSGGQARGLPVSVQLVSRPHQDEMVLKMLSTLEQLTKNKT